MTSRRTFLKLVTATAGTTLFGSGKVKAAHTGSWKDDALGILTDITLCIGCRTCEEACNTVNSLPKPDKPFDDLSVLTEYRRMTAKTYTVVNRFPAINHRDGFVNVKIQCMHCVDPACVSACLVGAMIKTREGPVIWNESKCIGCRYCMIACPFGVPAYEYYKGIGPRVMKCTMCYPRIKAGQMPGCAAACPMSVMTFGPRKELLEIARERIRKEPDKYRPEIYGEYEVGGTCWMFLAPQDFESLGFIKLGTKPPPRLTEGIQHGVFKYFIPPVALFGALGIAMMITKSEEEKPACEDVSETELKQDSETPGEKKT